MTAAAQLEPPLGSLHADWRDAWLPSLRGAATRARVAADPRLSGRLVRSIADRAGAPEAVAADLSPADLRAYRVAIAAPDRFRRLLGLAWHATALADVIDGSALRQLRAGFDEEDFAFAMGLDDLPLGARDIPSPERFAGQVEAAGDAVARAWGRTLPTAFAVRVKLVCSNSGNAEIDKLHSENHFLSSLVHRVAEFAERRA